MHLNLYTLVDPRLLEPGQILDTDDHGPLVVDELRRRNGSVVVYGRRLGSDTSRRVTVTYEGGPNQVSVLPSEDIAAEVWASVVEAVGLAAPAWKLRESERGGDQRPVPWTTRGLATLVVKLLGVEYWLDVVPPPADDPPAED